MSFMDGISKLSKSVADGAKTAAKKSGELVEVTKLNIEVSTEEGKISDIYKKIGKLTYDKFKNELPIDSELIDDCKQIIEIEEKINDLKQKMLQIKNVKICPNCSSEIGLDIAFCPKCGTKVENPSPVVDEEPTVETPTTKKCENCGTEVPLDSEFCTNCGNKF